MHLLQEQELKVIHGSGWNWKTGLIIGSIATFLIGLIDGFMRPFKCN